MRRILAPDGTVLDPERLRALALSSDLYRTMYSYVLFTRTFIDFANSEASLAVGRRIPLFISPKGQEAAEVASALVLGTEDWVFWYTRSQGAAFARHVRADAMAKLFYGVPDPSMVDQMLACRVMTPYVLVGIHLPHAVGFAYAKRIKNERCIVMAYFGDGAVSRPDFHSALNFASINRLPVIFVCENNQWAISTPNRLQTATKTFAEKACAYGIPNILVDGNDPFAMYETAQEAYRHASSGNGPTLIEAVTNRMDPHTTAIGVVKQLSPEEKRRLQEEDPLERMNAFNATGLKQYFGIEWTKAETAALCRHFQAIIKQAGQRAFDERAASDGTAVVSVGVALLEKSSVDRLYSEKAVAIASPVHSTASSLCQYKPERIPDVPLRHALGITLYDLMKFDQRVVVLGEDVSDIGSVHRTVALPSSFVKELLPEHESQIVTRYLPLQATFGKDRIIDTPVDEWGIMGFAIGLALGGLRPIVEVQFSNFVFGAGDHIFTELPRLRFRTAGRCPMPVVVMLPYGAGRQIECHRECEIERFLNDPGYIIVCPSTIQDARDLLWAAVASNKPVLFFFDKNMLGGELRLDFEYKGKRIKTTVNVSGELLRRPPTIPIEEFGMRIAREGGDITVTAYGRLVYYCLAAAELLAEENISVEVLDLRVFSPFDSKTLVNSVGKTGRLVVVHEESMFGGTGGEIAAIVTENAYSFERLRAPIRRVGPPNTYHPPPDFSSFYIPQPDRIAAAIRETVSFA